MAPAKTVIDDTPLHQLWRIFPHTYAEKCSGGRWIAFDYLRFISMEIAKAIAEGGGQIIIEAPPRHGKSEFLSFWTPVWFLDMFPNRRVILTSYGANLAQSFGRRVRNEIRSNELVSVNLSQDATAADKFSLAEGGGMATTGVGGPLTGKGGDLLLADDMLKNWQDASSDTIQEMQWDWWRSVFYTRREPGATVICLMTRWNQKDVAGRLQKEFPGKWRVIHLPAIAEEGDLMGRQPGQVLCPQRYDEKALAEIRAAVGSRIWGALFQQNPTPAEGEIWKRSWWRYWVALPDKIDQWIISADCTFKGNENSDFNVFQCWARKGADKFLVDQLRGQWGFTKALQMFATFCAKWPQARRKIIEDKANGTAIQETLTSKISGLIAVNPRGGKAARAIAAGPSIEAGNVYLPADKAAHPWVDGFVDESARFTGADGRKDDQVDSASQALLDLEDKAMQALRKLCAM